jgi:hypothetical protein
VVWGNTSVWTNAVVWGNQSMSVSDGNAAWGNLYQVQP